MERTLMAGTPIDDDQIIVDQWHIDIAAMARMGDEVRRRVTIALKKTARDLERDLSGMKVTAEVSQ